VRRWTPSKGFQKASLQPSSPGAAPLRAQATNVIPSAAVPSSRMISQYVWESFIIMGQK